MHNTLTAQQLNALQSWARIRGRNWKSELNHAWMTGDYGLVAYTHSLQQVRNQFGPSWLVSFNLKKALAAAATEPRHPEVE
jgi:hypothetical protein